jgi:cytidine deaminase
MTGQELIRLAIGAADNAYSPYSGFKVGAAILCDDGRVFTGCNIENASYSVTNCAERTALFKAVSEGARCFSAIAVVGGKDGDYSSVCTPCGVCRQALSEFCDPSDFKVYMQNSGKIISYNLDSLLPHSFGKITITEGE